MKRSKLTTSNAAARSAANSAVKKHEKKDKVRWIAVALAGVMLLGGTATSLVMGITQNSWFKAAQEQKQEQQEEQQAEQEEKEASNLVVTPENEEQGISLMSAFVEADDYDENGIATYADSAYTLTATVTPDTAISTEIDWTVEWVDDSVTEAVTDYVTVTPTEDGALTANVVCLRAFGKRIQVKASVRANSKLFATCNVDYVKRVTSVGGFLGSDLILNDDKVSYTPSSSTGSVLESGSTVSTLFCATLGTGTIEDTYSIKVVYMAEVSFFYNAMGISTVDYGVTFTADGYSLNMTQEFTGGRLGVGAWFPLTGSSANNNQAWNFANTFSSMALTYMQENPNEAIGTLQVIVTGKYSTFNKTYFVYPGDLSAVNTATAISLDQDNLLI